MAHKRQWGSFLDVKAVKRGSSGETTPEEKSFSLNTMDQLHPSGEKLFLSAQPRFIKSLEEPPSYESMSRMTTIL
jgi:hypothetical protein